MVIAVPDILSVLNNINVILILILMVLVLQKLNCTEFFFILKKNLKRIFILIN